MPKAGPWYFAWIDQPDPVALRNGTAFNPDVHNVMDEYVFSLKRILQESIKPTLELVIRNPHIGLLNTSRKQWAVLSRFNGTEIVPLFFGRLIAAPTDVFKELMTIRLVAWPSDYNAQRQAIAEAIKATGPYSPEWIEVAKRDDPDTILEAVSGLWHIDPVTHLVSISDILNGEDGNVDLTADEHLYEQMSCEFDQTSSVTAFLMDATVTWNQTGQGFIDMGSRMIESFAGDAIIADWPKPLASLGGGYIVASSSAIDSGGVASMQTGSLTISWTNKEKEHSDGDQLSSNLSITAPSGAVSWSAVGINMGGTLLTFKNQTGILDPFATDGNGDPSPTNIPPHTEATFAYVPKWGVSVSLVLLYRDLDRRRTERIRMLLQSDLQAIIVNPLVEQNSETIVKNAADVGIPIVKLLNRTTVAGQHVDEGTIVWPDNPSLPTLRTAQVYTTAGTTALTQPNFSDVPGVTTADGTAIATSLGTPAPTETAFDWPADTNIGLGTILLPRKPLYVTWQALTQSGRRAFPQQGTQVARGTLVQASNGSFQVATLGGLTRLVEPGFSSTRGDVTDDGSVEWTCLGSSLPDGKTHFLSVQAGRTGAQFLIPQFDNALHGRTTDNSVIWASIGPGDIPVGGTPGDVWARSYVNSPAGPRGIVYLASILRARGRLKARAVTVGGTPVDPFGKGLEINLRKTVSLHDPRLGGGVATGKAIYVEHACEGRSGRETCAFRIGCGIGKDNVIEAVAGEETYIDDYFEDYFETTGGVTVISDASDVGYTPPLFVSNDDGVVFPLTKSDIVISEGVRGDQSAQTGAVNGALSAMAQAARLAQFPTGSIDASAAQNKQIAALSANNVQRATALNPIWYEAVLKPLSGWQFNDFYNIQLTKLTCQRGIDLEAASTP